MEFKTFMFLVVVAGIAYFYFAPQYDLPLPEVLQNIRGSNISDDVINNTVIEVRNVTTETLEDGSEVVLVPDRIERDCNLESPLTPMSYEKISGACTSLGGVWELNSSSVSCDGLSKVYCYSSYVLELENVCVEEHASWTCKEDVILCEC